MRMILVTASLALLAACNGGASNNQAGNAAAPGNGANTAAPAPAAAPTAPADAELAAMRASGIRECSRDVSREAPAGTDAARLCGCAVDRLMAGRTPEQLRGLSPGSEQEAINACAAEQGVTLPAQPAGEDGNSAE